MIHCVENFIFGLSADITSKLNKLTMIAIGLKLCSTTKPLFIKQISNEKYMYLISSRIFCPRTMV